MGSLLLFFTSAQILYIATHPNKRRKCNSGFGKHVFFTKPSHAAQTVNGF